jgi:hypothetical protein
MKPTSYRINNLTTSIIEVFEHDPRAQHASIPTPFQLHVKLLRELDQRFVIICPKCNGEGTYTYGEGFSYARLSPCYVCKGLGYFEDCYTTDCQHYIRSTIISSRGPHAGKLKSRLPSYITKHVPDITRQRYNRAYYVWRMTRFHGGVDMTMPMMASVNCGHDPLIYELDAMADAIAQKAFGSNMRAAQRWTEVL